jgi:replicative DNA helicase
LGYFARGQKGASQYEKVTNAAMQLKAMAKSDDPAKRFFLVSPAQVNRLAKEGKPIDIDDARDSGAIEETADFLLSIWRPDDAITANPDGSAQLTGKLKCTVLKSRHGGKDTVIDLQMDLLTLAVVDAGSRAARKAQEHNYAAWRGTTYPELRAHETRPIQLALQKKDAS